MSAAVAAEPPFRRVCIAGVGLSGGSIARRARRTWPAIALTGVDRTAGLDTPDAAELFQHRAPPDRLAAVAAVCDLIILAMPVPAIVAAPRPNGRGSFRHRPCRRTTDSDALQPIPRFVR